MSRVLDASCPDAVMQELRLRLLIAELLVELTSSSRLHRWPPALRTKVRVAPGWGPRPRA